MRLDRRHLWNLLALIVVAAMASACVMVPMPEAGLAWTPAAVTAPAQAEAASAAQVEPTATPTEVPPTPTATATLVPTRTPTATQRPSATPVQKAAPTPTQGPQAFVVTEKDINDALSAGIGAEQGLVTEDLTVRFTNGKIHVTAKRLSYGMVNIRNLDLVGRLIAKNGQLQFEAESISPRGLFTSFIPTVANQALTQYSTQWYFTEVIVQDGRLELRYR